MTEHEKGIQEPVLRVIPLGGLEEVGRNSTIFEYVDPQKNIRDIIIVDLGLQFPEEAMMGIDYIIPNISYLKNKVHDIRGLVITHGHMDHIGAIPYLLDKLGNPPVWAGELARGIILKRQEEFPATPRANVLVVRAGDVIHLGAFEIEFIHVNHNIPDSFALAIRTPLGTLFHTGDYKFDRNPALQEPTDIGRIAHIGKEGVKLLLADSTSVIEEGYSIPEADIEKSLDEIFARFAKSRLIIATFSTLISRIQQVFRLAEKYGRKVALEGYSMKSTVDIAHQLGHITFDPKTLVSTKKAAAFPHDRVVILCTGAQGEENAVLMRIAQREHPHLKLSSRDVVLFSSSVIPGNERTIQGVHDALARQGAKVINYRMMDIHSGGHAYREDAKMLFNLTRPHYFIPIHGNHFMLRIHEEIACELGVKPEHIFVLDNGQVVNITLNNV
ncbi:MAG: ribonuclease J, partial [Candidatus Portnoybacteria bacterium]|nr:ribonuclease J [Candidatus Portnoybacteria bacterium]